MMNSTERRRRSRPFTSAAHARTPRVSGDRIATASRDEADTIIVSGSDTDDRPRRSRPQRSTGERRTSTRFSRPTSFREPRGGSSRFDQGRGRGRGRGRQQSSFDVSQYINRNPVTPEPEAPYSATHTFNDFGLVSELETAIADMGLVTPSPIQDQIIPLILDRKDVVGLAQTGTGKTAAFLIPTINATLKDRNRLTLILAPTRELAIQVSDELRKLTPRMGIYQTVCVGGVNIRPQIMNLKKRNHFIIGTPGRVMDLMDRGLIKPGLIKTVVLDEADRMLDMGFINDMRTILKDIPDERETLFFSATMSKSVEGLVHEFLKDPVTVSVRKKDITTSITQDVVYYEPHSKFDTLVTLLKAAKFERVIIFDAMKHSVEKLSQELMRSGVTADAIHGNKNHGQRQRALQNFKSGRVRVLVATDVAARGIHVDNVSHVINYDLPNTFEDYVHRIGRTGRADRRGEALTFVAK